MDWPRLGTRLRVSLPGLLLPLILVVALGLRLYGIDWDQGYGFHPDERSIYMRADCMYRVLSESPGYTECSEYRDHPAMEPGIPGPGVFLDAERSPLNPHWFPLGSILIYLIVAVRFVLKPFIDLGSLLEMSYIGRSIVVLADVGTVFMAYLLGKRIYGRRVGLLAAGLVTLAVVHIQHSHFYRPEPLLVFFLMVSFWFMLQVMERRRLRDSLLLGVFVGLTIATKVSVLPLVLPLALAYGFSLVTDYYGKWVVPSEKETQKVAAHALMAGAVAVAVFLITTPYALLDLFNFIADIKWQADMARTAGTVPFTVQYVGSTPFLYELRQTSVWALGLPLGIVAWGGLLFTLCITIFKVTKKHPLPRGKILFLAWVIANFLMLGYFFEVKFLRYIFPIMPFLILMGSGALFWMLDRARSVSASPVRLGPGFVVVRGLLARYAPHVVIGLIAFVVAATGFYALAFERVYARTHPAIQASRWINENISTDSTIVSDNHWDEGIRDIYSYKVRQIPIYEPDTLDKMDTIAGYLSEGEYLVFYSNRTYGSVARLPERYPFSSRYYQLLFSGELGYQVQRAFTSYPELLGVSFVDDTFTRARIPEPEALKNTNSSILSLNLGYADENVIDYDHPKVLLFKNVEGMPRSQLYDLLTRDSPAEPAPKLGLMLNPEQKKEQRQGGTWSSIIKRDSWTNKLPVLAWLLLVELIYLAALPLATFLFRPLPDRGIILARTLGILGVCYVAWLLASLGWVGFSRTSIVLGILVIASLSGLVLLTKGREFMDFLKKNWRLLTIGEALFLAAFLAFVAIKMANPDLWHAYSGGEKPMDFAYLNAVLRSTYMPPYDPWFAGGYLNYYYWGQFIVATLIKGTGIVPSVAYNLAVPLLFALTVTGAYSLVYNITAGLRRLSLANGEPPIPSMGAGFALEGSSPKGRDGGEFDIPLTPPHQGMEDPGEAFPHPSSRDSGQWARWVHNIAWGPVIAGLVAGLFVAVMGNLGGLVQLVKGSWNSVIGDEAFPHFNFWSSSRMLPSAEDVNPSALTFWLPDRVVPEVSPHITEFPFFSFLFADLHAHMIVIPFTLLAIGLAFSLMVGLRSAGVRWLIPTAAALSVAVGSLWAINSWDYPTYLILAVLLIGAGSFLRKGTKPKRLAMFLILAPAVVVLSILAFLPFHAYYHPFPTGLALSKWQTPLPNYLGIFAPFLFLSVTFLVYRWVDRRRRSRSSGVGKPSVDSLTSSMHKMRSASALLSLFVAFARVIRLSSWKGVAITVAFLVVAYMAVTGYWTVALMSLVLVFTLLAVKQVLLDREESSAYALVPLVLMGLALLIVIGVEFVRVKGDIGRMNTLLKYYLEVWVLLGMAAAYALWYLASKGFFRFNRLSLARASWLLLLALLLSASFIYPILGIRARLADRFPNSETITLDGADYMRTAVHSEEEQEIQLRWDYDAITWLQDNVKGSPVVLEAHNDQYHWSSRIADYTGLPTVLGWPWHQTQQRMRYDYAVRQRVYDIVEMYSTVDQERALELLKLYEVEYVVVGQLEQAYYPEEGLSKFVGMAREGLAKVVYDSGPVKIYQALWYN